MKKKDPVTNVSELFSFHCLSKKEGKAFFEVANAIRIRGLDVVEAMDLLDAAFECIVFVNRPTRKSKGKKK